VSTGGDLYWDPFDADLDASPHETWRRMRDEAPLYRNDRYDFWALSRYADVEAAHKDVTTFSSAHATVLELMGKEFSQPGQLIFLDPPDHTRLRGLVSRAFTPRRVHALEDHIRELCASMLDPHVGADRFDYVVDFGAQLPSRVISALVGVPEEEREYARKLVDTLFHFEPGVGMLNEISLNAQIELYEYLASLIDQRLAEPRDDMISALAHAEITDESGAPRRLDRDECATFVGLLFNAGTETVARLLGNAAVVLGEHPDQRAHLVADAGVIPNAVEELLRYEAPSPVQGRWTLRETTVHGVTIPEDSKVLLLTGAAGRDERAFADADRFDVSRKIDHHLSFGYGIHFCVGAALARLEGRIALEETLKRFPTWDVVHDEAVRLHTSTVRGWASVPIAP
jgi:cytochrome P450